MSLPLSQKKLRAKSLSKTLISSSAAPVLSAFMLMAATPAAHAQMNFNNLPVIDYTDCAEIVDNPGVEDAGAFVTIDTNMNCGRADGDFIELDGGQDNVVIIVESGTTLTSTDSSDEDVVFFVDNAENRVDFLIQEGATLRGDNGVIFLEGDETLLVNRGDILGTGDAEEGVIYIDRDTDGDENIIVNEGTGRITALANGPAIGIELLLADGFDDADDIGVQQAAVDFPNIRITNRAGGLISANGTVSDDNDAINVAGNPGSTGGFDRACLEGTAVNCSVTLRVINEGTIRSNFDNSGVAGITFEDDAVFGGSIVNTATGIIEGARNGIRIGDVEVDGLTAEHTGTISNRGTIRGNLAGSRGIDLEGDGVRITNHTGGTISGLTTGIEVGAGTSGGVEHSGVNNTIINRGTISGGSFSIDSSNAQGIVTIGSFGGTFTGDIRGSVGNADRFSARAGTTTLTHDVLQNVDIRVLRAATLNLVGSRTIEGRLISQGTVNFDLSDTQTVTGDVLLTRLSTVAISDSSAVAGIGDTFTLIDVGGTLDNSATLDASQAIEDGSFLVDFQFVDSADLVVEAVAAGAGSTSAKVSAFSKAIDYGNSSTEAFGEDVLTAFVEGGLNNTAAFSNLGNLGTANEVGATLASLAPDFSGNLVRNVFNTVQGGTAQIDHRLNDLNCNEFGDSRSTASLASDGVEAACTSFAETGAWVQSSGLHTSQGSLSLSGSNFFNTGSDQDSITMTYGYDQAVNDSTIVGFSGSYTESNVDEDNFAVSSSELDIVQFNAYAAHRLGNAQFVTKASYSHGEANTRRQSFEVIQSEVDVNGLNLQGVANYNVNLGQGYYLKPEAGFHYNNVTTSAFAETGGLNLNVDASSTNVLDGRAGLTLGARKIISDAARADLYVTGAIRNDFVGERGDLGYNFAGQSGSLAVSSIDQFAVQALAGVNVVSGKNFSFGAAVNSEFSNTENAVGGSLQTKLRW